MSLRRAAIVLLFAGCGAAAGCRSDPNIALLEAELRWMEDQYYGLENQYRRKCQELQSCRLANQALRQQALRATEPGARQPRVGEPTPAEPLPSSRRRNGESLEPAPPVVEGVPEVGAPGSGAGVQEPEPSGLDDQPLPRPPRLHEPLRPGNSRAPGALRSASWPQPAPAAGHLHDVEVLRIALNRQLTGGYDRDGLPGDDGILVVIEPQNRAGQFVPVAGPISLTLTDPRAADGSELVASWRLSEEQATARLRRSLLGRGLHLELPWPGAPPAASLLKLTVNFTTADGRKLLAEREIAIQPPPCVSSRWTPVSSRTPRTAAQAEDPRPAPSGGGTSSWQPYR